MAIFIGSVCLAIIMMVVALGLYAKGRLDEEKRQREECKRKYRLWQE